MDASTPLDGGESDLSDSFVIQLFTSSGLGRITLPGVARSFARGAISSGAGRSSIATDEGSNEGSSLGLLKSGHPNGSFISQVRQGPGNPNWGRIGRAHCGEEKTRCLLHWTRGPLCLSGSLATNSRENAWGR
jgi:hypothetical protein